MFRDIDEGLLTFYSNTNYLRHSKLQGIQEIIRSKLK